MDDRQKGLSYVGLGRKYPMDPRTAKRYAESPQKQEYILSEPKPIRSMARFTPPPARFPFENCHQLIEQLKKAHFENRLPDKLKVLSKYRMLIIDEIGYLPMDIQGANLFFQLIARRYEKTSTVFTSNKIFSQWNEVFANVTIVSAILDRVLHHCTVINIKGESYRLKEGKEFMRQKQQFVNTLFEQGNA